MGRSAAAQPSPAAAMIASGGRPALSTHYPATSGHGSFVPPAQLPGTQSPTMSLGGSGRFTSAPVSSLSGAATVGVPRPAIFARAGSGGSFVGASNSRQGSLMAPAAASYAPATQSMTVNPSARSFGSFSHLEGSESYVPPAMQSSPCRVPRSLPGTAPGSAVAPLRPPMQAEPSTAQLAPGSVQATVAPWQVSAMRAAPRPESTSLLGGPGCVGSREDAGIIARLQADLEQCRMAAEEREHRMAEITQSLLEEKESRERAERENEDLSAKIANMATEIHVERVAREQAEAAAMESQVALHQERSSSTRLAQQVAAHERSPAPRSPGVTRATSRGVSRDRPAAAHTDPAGKDEIDSRLLGWLDRNGCCLTFRRKNRGWYAFRRVDETGPASRDKCVEISIVGSGKLMAKVEPSANDAGWNNGKSGTMERFVAYYSALEN